MLQNQYYHNTENTDKYFREKYLHDLELYIKELRNKNIKIILNHNTNQHLTHLRIFEFYKKI